MKRLLSAALALTLLGGSAAYAGPYGGYGHYYGGHRHFGWRHDDAGAAVAVGVGALALIAILAAQDRERHEAQYQGPPPNYPDNTYPDNAYRDNGPPANPDARGGSASDQPPAPPGAYPGGEQ